MRIITIEEHTAIATLGKALAKYPSIDAQYSAAAPGKDLPYYIDGDIYTDVGEKRIADMDKNGITLQILSCPVQTQLLPPNEAASVVRDSNDELAEAIARYPDRFGAFAVLPWSNPNEAAKELARVITKLGFSGAILSGRASSGAEFLDDKRFVPILEAAEELNAPIYVHPAPPMQKVQELYYSGFEEQLSARLSLYGWGWHNEAGVQILRMILSGAFERFPKLQLIGGHWGEMVPFFLSRLDQALPQKLTKLSRTITQTFSENVYVTPSGIFDYPQLKFICDVLGADRIIHSVDFPFIANTEARAFIENAPISEDDKKKIAHLNVEKLCKAIIHKGSAAGTAGFF